MYIDRWGRTDKGQQRIDNQDSIYFAQAGKQGVTQAQIEAHGVLLAVADGVGGDLGGHEASAAVIRHLVAAYYSASTVDPVNNLRQAIRQADQLAQQEVTYRQAATTLVTAVIWQNQLFVANIGDSRGYWIRGKQIHQLTDDHVQDGKLARYLVSYPNVQPDMVQLPGLEIGDRILLCSDGLYDPIPEADEIRSLATKGGAKQAANRLIKKANEYGGPDNVSVVIAYLRERPPVAFWQMAVITGFILLLMVTIGLLASSLWRTNASGPVVPTLMATAVVPEVVESPTLADGERTVPILVETPQEETTDTLVSTVTPAPTRTLTPTPSATPLPPTPTYTFTPRPTNPPTYTSTPTIIINTPTPLPETPLPTATDPPEAPDPPPTPEI